MPVGERMRSFYTMSLLMISTHRLWSLVSRQTYFCHKRGIPIKVQHGSMGRNMYPKGTAIYISHNTNDAIYVPPSKCAVITHYTASSQTKRNHQTIKRHIFSYIIIHHIPEENPTA